MLSRKLILTVVITTFLAGCKAQQSGVSQIPLIDESLGEGPWQVVTYDNRKVFHETLALDGKTVTTRSETVYVSNKSQFVYRDGTPIQTHDGKYLYWNKDGWIINRFLQVVPEDQVFVVEGKPMPIRTAMKLRDYHQGSRMVTLAGSGKAE